MAAIVLATLNARYTHASLGLRYLRANLGIYRDQSVLKEFTIKRPALEIADEILALNPRVLGLGVYIWNTNQTLDLVRVLKSRRPDLIMVLGGPEISYETEGQELTALVDFVFQGESDFTFRDFVANWFERGELPASKIVKPALPEIGLLSMPYAEYDDEDIAHRTLYVEASRGCPYKCEYCLSALDVSVRAFKIEAFLAEMQKLIGRGARQFKFVDRTFNLSPTVSGRILEFFLAQAHLGLFLHFEMVPDRLDDNLKTLIQQFPAGALQFEIGVQTWNPTVARNVSRRQNFAKIGENFRFLREATRVHTHADLIVGLPGETRVSFGEGFNALFALQPDEIQVGILKRLKGTPIVRHDEKFAMRYSPHAPFEILQTKDMSSQDIAELKIFAEFWDLLANSGRFPGLVEMCRERAVEPFGFFYDLAVELFAYFGRTHSIHLTELEMAVQTALQRRQWPLHVGIARLKRNVPASATPARQVLHLDLST
jgi:radical SAM superfamily enzyme YgiQ (UPF0313 family)